MAASRASVLSAWGELEHQWLIVVRKERRMRGTGAGRWRGVLVEGLGSFSR